MKIVPQRLAKKLHHKKLGKSAAAIAGFASAVSVLLGVVATRVAPKGFSKISVALGLSKAPLIVKLAPIVAGIAVAAGITAGIVNFYSWWKEGEGDLETGNSDTE